MNRHDLQPRRNCPARTLPARRAAALLALAIAALGPAAELEVAVSPNPLRPGEQGALTLVSDAAPPRLAQLPVVDGWVWLGPEPLRRLLPPPADQEEATPRPQAFAATWFFTVKQPGEFALPPLRVLLVGVDSNDAPCAQDPGRELEGRAPVGDVHEGPALQVLSGPAEVDDLYVLIGLLARHNSVEEDAGDLNGGLT